MIGIVVIEVDEFEKIYKLKVIVVFINKFMICKV